MGIVIKQSFWGTVIAYVGVLIGYFNALYLRPEFLSLGEIGIFSLITANAMMISPFCSAGMPATWIRQYPTIAGDPELKNQYFSFQMLVVIALNIFIVGVGYLTKNLIIAQFQEASSDYIKYLAITAVIIVINSLFEMLYSYCRTILQILIPSFLRDIFLRIGAIILVGGIAIGWWDFDFAAKGLALNYLLSFACLLAYLLLYQGVRFTFNLDRMDAKVKKQMLIFGGYFMLLALSFALMNNASYSQIAAILGNDATGIFTICFFIGVIVEMPRRNMIKVISPIFSKSMKEGNMDQVKRMYQKGSLTMTIIGILLMIGIVTNVNDLFAFIPKGNSFREGYWVVICICIAKLIKMLFSFSSEVIVFSDKYRYSLYAQILSAFVLILLNIVLLPKLGLMGAGISYLAAMTVLSVIKFIWVKLWFNISPFTKAHISLLLVSAAIMVLCLWMPFPFSPLLNIIIRSVLITVLFVSGIYAINISPDINQVIRTTFEKISQR